MQPLKPTQCKRCGKVLIDLIHTCSPMHIDPTEYGYIEYWSNGTTHPVYKSSRDIGQHDCDQY